ncbi:hypothetical protein, partial [Endozoicomonas sp.]|uniref:hypothetical protein n=1 Tax=Endozoicomonas sp. TaxID=1892382 RepID=UPI00383A9AB2
LWEFHAGCLICGKFGMHSHAEHGNEFKDRCPLPASRKSLKSQSLLFCFADCGLRIAGSE